MEDKSCLYYAKWISILEAKEELEQKNKYLLYMEEVYQWQVKERILENEAELVSLRDFYHKLTKSLPINN